MEEISSKCNLLNWEDYGCSVDDVSSITLTPEILLSNAFEDRRNVGFIDDYYDGTSIICDLWDNRIKITKDYNEMLNISYFFDIKIHELQHALRLCGFDKTIELC